MDHSSRILSTVVAAILTLAVGANLTASAEADGASRDLTVVAATKSDQSELEWALNRYDDAGLELPPLVIEFHTDRAGCDGGAGVFRGREQPVRIEVCVPNRYVVMHELAHAWDHHNLNDEKRRAFMELRGLTVWNHHDAAWKDRGIEALAETITWGLYDHDHRAHERGTEKAVAFELITGGPPRRNGTNQRRTEVDVPDDPVEAGSAWDELR